MVNIGKKKSSSNKSSTVWGMSAHAKLGRQNAAEGKGGQHFLRDFEKKGFYLKHFLEKEKEPIRGDFTKRVLGKKRARHVVVPYRDDHLNTKKKKGAMRTS